MEKQYSTHYLPEKYKQHQFIDIYNFEITVLKILKTQSTALRQKSQGNRDVRLFSTRARGSGYRVSLVKQPRPSLDGSIIEKLLPLVFCQLFASKSLSRARQSSQIQDQIGSQLCPIKISQYKRACISHLILVRILSILILSVKDRRRGGGGGGGGGERGGRRVCLVKRDKGYLPTVPKDHNFEGIIDR